MVEQLGVLGGLCLLEEREMVQYSTVQYRVAGVTTCQRRQTLTAAVSDPAGLIGTYMY